MIMIERAAGRSPDDIWIGNEIMVPEGKRRMKDLPPSDMSP